MNITYYGHACFSVEVQGKHLLFDPFITPNQLASSIDIASVKADYILITHAHFDHLADLEHVLKHNPDAKIASNFETVSWIGNKYNTENVLPMNQGGKRTLDFGAIKYVTAIHSSSLPDGSNGGNPGGFVVETPEGNFYHTGDTALTYDMKLIGDYMKVDFSMMCIGDVVTMGVEDAIIACDFVKCNKVLGMHYDTFPFIKIDPAAAKAAFEAKGKELILMGIGETMEM